MPSQSVLLSIDVPIATITLTQPAIDEQAAFELRDICQQMSRDESVWAVILTGSGDVFCKGTDLASISDDGRVTLDSLRLLKVSDSVVAIEKPVIAALNGDAIDQGLELALACDIRIVSNHARLGLTHLQSGTIPWDGGTQRLPRLIGRSRATEMILTSRLINVQEALEIGLVNEFTAPDQLLPRAREIAQTIANHGPIASRYLKEAVFKGLDMTLDQGLRLEADLNFILQSTSDRAEGIGSFLQKRTPEYRGE